jgi:hypothetical protein
MVVIVLPLPSCSPSKLLWLGKCEQSSPWRMANNMVFSASGVANLRAGRAVYRPVGFEHAMLVDTSR